MANESGKNERRVDFPYWDGVNAVVSKSLAKKSQFRHAENIRSVLVGTVEKRAGQRVIGHSAAGSRFVAQQNFSLFFKNNASPGSRGLYRISRSGEPISTFSVQVFEDLTTMEHLEAGDSVMPFQVYAFDHLTIAEPPFVGSSDTTHFYLDNIDYTGSVYHLNDEDVWTPLADPEAKNIPGGDFQNVIADGNIYLVNGRASNRYIKQNHSVIDSTQPGNLYNSPKARLVNFYKNRLYVGDFVQGGVRYPTTMLRSSYPLGIVALVNGDKQNADQAPLASGVVSFYKFDESAGNPEDAANGKTLINSGAPYAPGLIGNAINLAGGSFDVKTDDNMNINGGPVTLGVTFKLASDSAAEEWPLATVASSAAKVIYTITYVPSGAQQGLHFKRIAEGVMTKELIHVGQLGTTDWHFAQLTYDGINLRGYLDTVQTGTIPAAGNGTDPVTSGFAIGSNPFGSDTYQYAKAAFDSTAVWNRAISQDEVNDFSNGGAGVTYPLTDGWTISVTDTKYFYADSGMNEYEIWRGNTKIGEITVTRVNETSIEAATSPSLLSSDEIWVKGTYAGEKQFRWINNATAFGTSAKQYDTFKLAGGNETELTLLDNIGNVMIIGSRNNLATWNDYTFEQFDLGIGCVSKRGYVRAFGTMYFLDYTGVYATSGSLPTIISSPVQPYIDGATKAGKENAVAGKKDRSVFFCIGDVTLYNTDGSVKRKMKDVCLEYNLLQQNWYVHSNVKATEFETFVDELENDRLVYLDTGGIYSVKAFLEGSDDDGDEIFMQAETHPIPLSTKVEEIANAMGVVVEMERGTAVQCYVCLDDDGKFFQIEGKALKGVTSLKVTSPDPTKQNTPPTCRNIALSFRESSNQKPKLGKVAIQYLPLATDDPSTEPIVTG